MISSEDKTANVSRFLSALGSNEWWYVSYNDTLYTDLNRTLTTDDLVIEILKNTDPNIVTSINDILNEEISRVDKVKYILSSLEKYPVSKLVNATIEATKKIDLRSNVKEFLPSLYPTRLVIYTGILEILAEIYVKKKICPLYYRDVPIEDLNIRRIAVIGSIHDEEDGVLTGRTLYVPDDYERLMLSSIDILKSLGYENETDKLKKLVKYPHQSKEIVYVF